MTGRERYALHVLNRAALARGLDPRQAVRSWTSHPEAENVPVPAFYDPRLDEMFLVSGAPSSKIHSMSEKLGFPPYGDVDALLAHYLPHRTAGANNYMELSLESLFRSSPMGLLSKVLGGVTPEQHTMTIVSYPGMTPEVEYGSPQYLSHFSAAQHPNVLVHTRGFTLHEPEHPLMVPRARYVDEVQSDWAQRWRPYAHLGKLPRPIHMNRFIPDMLLAAADPETLDVARLMTFLQRYPEVSRLLGVNPDDPEIVRSLFRPRGREFSVPPYDTMEPPIGDTRTWTKIGLKSELAQAIDDDASHLVLYDPMVYVAGHSETPALHPYYAQIVPESLVSLVGAERTTPLGRPFAMRVDIPSELRRIYRTYRFPYGGGRPRVLPKEQLTALERKAVQVLTKAGFPTSIAMILLGLVPQEEGES